MPATTCDTCARAILGLQKALKDLRVDWARPKLSRHFCHGTATDSLTRFHPVDSVTGDIHRLTQSSRSQHQCISSAFPTIQNPTPGKRSNDSHEACAASAQNQKQVTHERSQTLNGLAACKAGMLIFCPPMAVGATNQTPFSQRTKLKRAQSAGEKGSRRKHSYGQRCACQALTWKNSLCYVFSFRLL